MSESLQSYYRYWGKAEKDGPGYHLLPYHCLDVAAVGRILLDHQPALLRQFGDVVGIASKQLLDWCTFLLSIHDVGKYADGFQNLRPDVLQQFQKRVTDAAYRERHDTLGFLFCRQNIAGALLKYDSLGQWHGADQNDLWDILELWIGSVTGHHGHPPKLDAFTPSLKIQIPDQVRSDILDYIQSMIKLLLPDGIPFQPADYDRYYQVFPRISWLVAGIAVAADWTGSNKNWFPYRIEPMPLNEYWRNIALTQAKNAVAECGLSKVGVAGFSGMQTLFTYISSATPLQKLAEEIEIHDKPQLFIIEEVTGGGKTEAALTLTHRLLEKGLADGLFMALPTMATANAMHTRVQAMYRKLFLEKSNPSLILAHSFSRMVLDMEVKNLSDNGYGINENSASQDCSAWLLDSRKKSLLAHVGVGTIDQVLLSILAVRHQSLRLFGLSRKVLIVDEVHACDAYVHRLLCTVLQFHAAQGGSAILLSATLPQTMRDQLLNAYAEGTETNDVKANSASYPLLTRLSTGNVEEFPVEARFSASRQVEVQFLHSIEEIKTMLRDILDAGGCACWVRNTVFDALQAHREWVDLLGEDSVILFHARFTLGDRLTMEQEVISYFGPNSTREKRKGKLLIATQVVEQSLDLDFDFMVTDLAPIDLIIQRAGRLQRHARGPRMSPVLGVFTPPLTENADKDWFKSLFPKAAKVYDHHGQLWLTAKWLNDRQRFIMPENAREMIESVYGESSQTFIPERLQTLETRADGEDKADASLGSLNSLNLNEGYRATLTHWQDDAYAPTRLGEPTIMVRLGRWDGVRFTPWFSNDTGHDWELSQVSVRKSQIAKEDTDYLLEAVTVAKGNMPDKGEHCIVIPLVESDGKWLGQALNSKGAKVSIVYSSRTGLEITKGENHESD